MGHIHTNPGQHDATVSAYIVRLDGSEPMIILHRHKKLHKWLQFGGHVELHENPWDAITHEVAEESGYEMRQLKLLQPELRLAKVNAASLHPVPVAVVTHQFSDTDHYHTDTGYVFVTSEPPANGPEEGESSDIKLWSATEIAAFSSEQIPPSVQDICLFVLEKCLKHWVKVDTADFSA